MPIITPPSGYLTAEEAGRDFHLSSDYISRLCRQGSVQAIRDSRRWLVERRSLAAYVEESAQRRREQAEALRKARRREYRRAKGVLGRIFSR